MDVLIYNELDVSRVKRQYEKILEMLKLGDFYSAGVRKLVGSNYYRAKLDDTNRLLFALIHHQKKKYVLILEVIHQHAYDKSRFLRGAKINESKILSLEGLDFAEESTFSLPYLNPQNTYIHLLDKIISFDSHQENVFSCPLPLILIGSAGSGKTMLSLEKMKGCMGKVLYVTGSAYLVENARTLYYAHHYSKKNQAIDFLSYRELLEGFKKPGRKESNFQSFSKWLIQMSRTAQFQDANKLYEEFKGVLTGNQINAPYLKREEYLALGVKQSIFQKEERALVYDIFQKYLLFLQEAGFYESNILSFERLSFCLPRYDFVVVDEVQDFTPIQLQLIFRLLILPQHFILCGDSNQIVHPNFFSWSKIKSLFYLESTPYPIEVTRILNKNYRNAPTIMQFANKILKTKNARFGSIDKESHYLVESQSELEGALYCLKETAEIRTELNQKTRQSTHFAVIVLREELKEKAARYFETPLIFSIYEAKGIEYENVILYNFVSSEAKSYQDIAQGLHPQDLLENVSYARVKNKTDRSLEIYKFFINALYVAITRAIKNVYWLESKGEHPLFKLWTLDFQPQFLPLTLQSSSLSAWKKEAERLDLQGKEAQAQAIRTEVLHEKGDKAEP